MCRQSASVCLIKSRLRQHRAPPGLPQRLATLADPRHRRGKRHPFVSVLLIACSAVLAGARSFAAIGSRRTHMLFGPGVFVGKATCRGGLEGPFTRRRGSSRIRRLQSAPPAQNGAHGHPGL